MDQHEVMNHDKSIRHQQHAQHDTVDVDELLDMNELPTDAYGVSPSAGHEGNSEWVPICYQISDKPGHTSSNVDLLQVGSWIGHTTMSADFVSETLHDLGDVGVDRPDTYISLADYIWSQTSLEDCQLEAVALGLAPKGPADMARMLKARQGFLDIASSDEVRNVFAPAISATLISIIQSMEAVEFKAESAGLPNPAWGFELPPPTVSLSGFYWPDLKRQLRALAPGADWMYPDLECAICRDRMAFVGHFSEEGHLAASAAEAMEWLHVCGQEAAVVLPCGHVFGRECMDKIKEQSALQACPICKANLKCQCGTALDLVPVPVDRVQLQRFALTVLERSQFPCTRDCDKCKFKEWSKRWGAEVLAMLGSLCPALVMPIMMASNLMRAAGFSPEVMLSEQAAEFASLRPGNLKWEAFERLGALMAKAEQVIRHVNGKTGWSSDWIWKETV